MSDPDAMLYRKGPGMEAKLCFIGHALMENRHGLIVDTRLTRVSEHAERLAALEMIEPRADRPEAITLGGDRGFDAAEFVMELRDINVAAVRLLVLTGARLGEILSLRWADVNFEHGMLLLGDSKTGRKTVFLSKPALELLNTLPRILGNPHVIAGARHGQHLKNLQKPWGRI